MPKLISRLMSVRMFSIILVSFLFAQISCAMSEGYEIVLEAEVHAGIAHVEFDVSELHNEQAEHEGEMPSAAHCVHSHPPVNLILNALEFFINRNIILYNVMFYFDLIGVDHQPPLTPLKSNNI